MAEMEKKDKKEEKPHSGRYDKSPKIEPIESKGDTGKTVARDEAAKAAKSTAGASTPQASMDKDEGPEASDEMGTAGVPVSEMHSTMMKDMVKRQKGELSDMHSRHQAEHAKMLGRMAKGNMEQDESEGTSGTEP